MATNIYLKLNNYNYKDDYIDIVKTYLRRRILPNDFSHYQRIHLQYQYKDFEMRGNDIYYKPLNLKVIPESKKQETLTDLYNNPAYGTGAGIRSFYNKVNGKYLGIKRKDVEEFLKNQQFYQLTKSKPNVVNRPIIAKYPNHRWAVDLVDMNYYIQSNRGYRYILSCIDFFSKKVFAIPLKNKEGETARDGLESICSKNNTYPLIIQSDNGGEFIDQSVKDWASAHEVKLVRTLSYTPTSNGLIENFNNILRKMIREGFIRNNNLNWVDHLNQYIENRNNSKHSTTKYTPNQIWKEGREPLDKLTKRQKDAIREDDRIINDDEEKLNKVVVRLEDKAGKMLDKAKEDFEPGDRVRVLTSALHSKIRSLIKSGNAKYIVVKYSPEIYYIDSVLKPKGPHKDFRNKRYTLRYNSNGQRLLTELKLNNPDAVRGQKIFFGSDLQKVDLNKMSDSVLGQGQADRLNKIQTPEFDELIYLEEQKKKKEREESKPKEKTKEPIEEIDRSHLKRNKPKIVWDV